MTSDLLSQDMVFVGLEGAGKTSIISRMFKFFSTDEIIQLTPTVLMDASLFSVEIVQHPIAILDLGGQEEYLSQHLSNPAIFTNSRIIVYVVDVQRPDSLNRAIKYFSQVKSILQQERQPPREFLLLHKFDKTKRDELSVAIPSIMTRLLRVLGNNATVFLTSIYDDSLLKAFTYILSFLFPLEVLSQSLTHKITTRALPTLIHTTTSMKSVPPTKKASRLYSFMSILGNVLANNIVQREWYYYFARELRLSENTYFKDQSSEKSLHSATCNGSTKPGEQSRRSALKMTVIINSMHENRISFELALPFQQNTVKNEEYLILIAIQGLIKGTCNSLGRSLRQFTLIPYFNSTSNNLQVEGVFTCH